MVNSAQRCSIVCSNLISFVLLSFYLFRRIVCIILKFIILLRFPPGRSLILYIDPKLSNPLLPTDAGDEGEAE